MKFLNCLNKVPFIAAYSQSASLTLPQIHIHTLPTDTFKRAKNFNKIPANAKHFSDSRHRENSSEAI